MHLKTLPQYSTRTMAEELGYATGGESHPLEVKMNLHLPLPGQPRLTDVCAWRAPALTGQGNQAIYIQIDERINRYEMNIFVVDEITGRMYAKIGGKLHSIREIGLGPISRTRPVLGNEHWRRSQFRKALLQGNAWERSQHELLGQAHQ